MQNGKILEYLRALKSNPRFKIFEKIGIFGSYATQKADAFSDVDVVVSVNKKYLETHDVWDYFDAINSIKEGIAKKFHLQSDVFDIESVSPLKKEIMKDAIYV
jgi:predicted nucleotidyltransferase